MPDYRLQRLRGGWAIATYERGCRVARNKLPAADASEAAGQFRRLVEEFSRPARLTVEQVWDDFSAARAGRPVARTMGFERRAVLAHFGALGAEEITREDSRRYIEHRRAAGRRDGTIWTELGHLRAALRFAAAAGKILRAPTIERPPKPEPRDRHLTRAEAELLLDAAQMPHVRLFVVLAIATGGRRGALLGLTWERVDFAAGLIFLRDASAPGRAKGRATVPMNGMARAALAAAKEGARTPFVIEWAGRRVGSVRRGIAAAAARAGLTNVTPHVLRHTAAVWMAEAGTPMSEIAQYLGHADDRLTQAVYARFSPGHLRRAAGALEFGRPRSV